mmetsp:Transcript_77347/g.145897  ORF Transcript_77347/g.145897 Transcript_77347/m.145897 type:complete len:182 (-) Transcript_77347:60-605(-)
MFMFTCLEWFFRCTAKAVRASQWRVGRVPSVCRRRLAGGPRGHRYMLCWQAHAAETLLALQVMATHCELLAGRGCVKQWPGCTAQQGRLASVSAAMPSRWCLTANSAAADGRQPAWQCHTARAGIGAAAQARSSTLLGSGLCLYGACHSLALPLGGKALLVPFPPKTQSLMLASLHLREVG